MEIVNYDVFSGDAEPFAPAATLQDNVLRAARGGAIVLMHFNHPRWNEKEALTAIVPILREKGYSFVKLEDFSLLDRKSASTK
jgi:peptidoglycan/xylan/chitin deacetylase (PgdA/CDA1 family)